ncbi:MAG TPA: hypothetical protein VK905_02055 [Bacillota bacterium]|nr:hypothetical protein [Bacillota bacterium]
MSDKARKMVAPVVVTVVILLYYVFVVRLLFLLALPGFVRVLIVVIPMGVAVGMGIVLKERINEIRSGEEDDLSKY